MNMKTYHINAPVKIVTANLGITDDYKQQCIQETYKIGDKQGQKTNVKAIMSSYALWEDSNVYNPLLDQIITEITNKLYPLGDDNYEYVLVEAWSAIYKEGHYTIPHDHRFTELSFVYYLKADSNSSPLKFDDCDFEVNIEDDLLVIFPGTLIHSVPKHKGEDRICVVGDFKIRAKE